MTFIGQVVHEFREDHKTPEGRVCNKLLGVLLVALAAVPTAVIVLASVL